MASLLGAQCRELKSVVRSERSNNLGGDNLFVNVGQWDLEDNRFTLLKVISHESS
jgi:hypothetical protein